MLCTAPGLQSPKPPNTCSPGNIRVSTTILPIYPSYPGLPSRYALFVESSGLSPLALGQAKKVQRLKDNEAKRWVRRRENGTSHKQSVLEFVLLYTTTTVHMYEPLASQKTHTSWRRQSVISSPLTRPPYCVYCPPPTVSPVQHAAPRKHPTSTGCPGERHRAVQPLPAHQAQGAPALRRPLGGPLMGRRG